MQPLKLIISQAILLSSLASLADTKIRTVADWSLWESSDGKTCYIITDNYNYNSDDPFNNEATVSFGFSKVKNAQDKPVEILLKYKTNKNRNSGAFLSLSGVDKIGVADLDGKRKTYWGLSKKLSAFIQRARSARGMITVKPVGGRAEEVDLSTSGVNDIVSEMERRCNQGKSLVNLDFENQLLAQTAATIDPTRLDPAKVQQVRALYFASYKTFDNLAKANADLEDVLSKYRHLLEELERNLARIDQINNVDLPNQQNILTAAIKQQAEAQTEISRLNSLIPDLTAQVAVSLRAYDAARSILAPLEPEYQRLTSALSNAQDQQLQAERRLAFIDSRIDQIQRQIYSLDTEAREIERHLPQKKYDLDRAYDRLRDAQNQRSNFHPNREVEKALRRNTEYNRLQSELQQAEANLRRVEEELNRLKNERQQLALALNDCKAATPAKDCSSQEAALNAIEQVISIKQSERQQEAARVDQIRNRITTIVNQMEMEVRRAYEQLERAEDRARLQYEQISRELIRDQDRLAAIRHREIPNLENELSQLRYERPSVIATIDRARYDVSRLTEELARFKATNEWDRKLADVNRTRSQLEYDQSVLAKAQRDLQKQKDLLTQGIATEARAKAMIEALNKELTALAERNAELNRGLSNLPVERAPIDQRIKFEKEQFENQRQQLIALLA